jgi:Rieske Fe-S protein
MWRIAVRPADGPLRTQDAGRAGRRRLLRGSLFAGIGALALAATVQFERFLGTAIDWRSALRFSVAAREVPKPGDPPRYIAKGRFYLVNLRPGEGGFEGQPGSPHGGIVALEAKCPHRGCTLPWRPDFRFEGAAGWFRCPCHGSTFTRAGLRAFGPAPHAMDTFPVTRHRDGSLSVRWKEPRRGATDGPARTTVMEPRVIGCPFGAAICGPSIEEPPR